MLSARCLAALSAAGILAACQAREPAAPEANDVEETRAVSQLPVADPPLDREALLLAVARAASATSLGRTDDLAGELDGRRFELRMRFGCGHPTDAANGRQVSFDQRRHVLRISIAPEISTATPWLGPTVGAEIEDTEGFWILRPWVFKPACPRIGAAEADAGGASAPEALRPGPEGAARVGIAQFFTAADARTHRRDDRAYTVTKVLSPDERPSGEGYDFVISGRLRRWGDSVVVCTGDGAAAPPRCIISAQFERVAVEDPRDGELVAKWSTG